jgi:hypothetical protein
MSNVCNGNFSFCYISPYAKKTSSNDLVRDSSPGMCGTLAKRLPGLVPMSILGFLSGDALITFVRLRHLVCPEKYGKELMQPLTKTASALCTISIGWPIAPD